LDAEAANPDLKARGEAILALARQASSKVHTYLKFVGD